MEKNSFVPKRWPSMWLDKDWENRSCKDFEESEETLQRIHDLELRDDDVWLITLPKCGTTWMQEMAWLILNSFDFKTALSTDLDDRSPFLEIESAFPPGIFESISITERHPSPRLIKTHLPLPLLPYQVWTKRPKIIYVFRHPKDAVVSGYYHLNRILKNFEPKEVFLKHFFEDNEEYWLHVHEFWSLRNEPNVYYTSYERMKSDLPSVIQDVCKFLNVEIDSCQLAQMLDHLSFENMKNNKQCNHHKETALLQKYGFTNEENSIENSDPLGESKNQPSFIRKGQVGGYKDDFTKELDEKYDRWIEESLEPFKLRLDDLLFPEKNVRPKD